jgi:hypothetical protein
MLYFLALGFAVALQMTAQCLQRNARPMKTLHGAAASGWLCFYQIHLVYGFHPLAFVFSL